MCALKSKVNAFGQLTGMQPTRTTTLRPAATAAGAVLLVAAPSQPHARGCCARRRMPTTLAAACTSASLSRPQPLGSRCRPRRGPGALRVFAMVNVDFASPSLVLGTVLIGCGIALLQARNLQRRVSRDADIVVAAMISIVGSTLIFQGWRLDPLLLLCQALTTSVAFYYGLESFKLRSRVAADEAAQEQAPQLPPPADGVYPYESFREGAGYGAGPGPGPAADYYAQQQNAGYLPPGTDRPAAPWAGTWQPEQQQQQQQAQAQYSGRWGAPPTGAGSGSGRGSAGEAYMAQTIRYDYYGNPQEPFNSGLFGADGGYPGAAPVAQEAELLTQDAGYGAGPSGTGGGYYGAAGGGGYGAEAAGPSYAAGNGADARYYGGGAQGGYEAGATPAGYDGAEEQGSGQRRRRTKGGTQRGAERFEKVEDWE